MDFRPNPQPSSSRPTPVTPVTSVTDKKDQKSSSRESMWGGGRWLQILSLVIITGVAILLASVALAIARGNKGNESQFVDTGKYQAVFLNNGQVYFGKVLNLNSQYMRISNVYYLNSSTPSSTDKTATPATNYTLVKLGCQQIPGATDQIVINRSQISYWENLLTNGKAAAAIQSFQKQNPNGPDCTQTTNQAQTSGTSSTTGSSSTAATTNSSSSTTK